MVFVALHSDEQREACATLLGQAGYAIYDLSGAAPHSRSINVDEIYAQPGKLVRTALKQS